MIAFDFEPTAGGPGTLKVGTQATRIGLFESTGSFESSFLSCLMLFLLSPVS